MMDKRTPARTHPCLLDARAEHATKTAAGDDRTDAHACRARTAECAGYAERIGQDGRTGRSEPGECSRHTGCGESGERAERSETERFECSECSERTECTELTERAETTGQTERTERAKQAEQTDRTEQTEKPERTGALADVAILLPAFNGQADVARTLASFCEDAPVYALVVDDGSVPPLVAPAVPGMTIDVLRLAENGGIERALQTGIDALAARGYRYAARIDAGDLAIPHRLARQRTRMQAAPALAALGTWCQVVDHAGRALFLLTPSADARALRRTRFLRSPLVHPSVMLRIDAVRAVGNYRAAYPAAEDLDLFLRLMERYDCANLPEPGLYYVLNEGGISATRRRRQIVSTLRLQGRYFDARNPCDWLGLAKTLLHFVTPYRALQRIKRALYPARP